MTTADDWKLSVHYWHRATEAGVRPRACIGFPADDAPDLYRAHDIDFSHAPTREDFLAVVAQTPWMQCWEADLLPLIAKNQWPQIALGHKAASVDLVDNTGRCVGRVEVSRRTRYCNALRPTLGLWIYSTSPLGRLLQRRVRGEERRQQARDHVERHRHLIVERAACAADSSDAAVLVEVERVLTDGGFLTRRRRAA